VIKPSNHSKHTDAQKFVELLRKTNLPGTTLRFGRFHLRSNSSDAHRSADDDDR